LRLTPIKLSFWYLIKTSYQNREALDHILKIIMLNASNPNAFVNFIRSVQANVESFIPFYQHEIWNVVNIKYKYPPLHIIAHVDGKSFKRVLVDGGSAINVVPSVTWNKLNLPLSYLQEPTLILCAFNNQLCNTLVAFCYL